MSAVRQETPNVRPLGLRNKDRRQNRRVELEIKGRFLDEESEDNALITTNISCGGALIESEHRPQPMSRIVCYFDNLGRVSASVTRQTETGFAIRFHTTQHKRDKLADKLIWLMNRDPFNLKDERRAPRYAAGGPALVRRADGRDIQCRVIDISLTGASFRTDAPRPAIGEIVKAGNVMGEVVRCEESLFAIRYLTKRDAQAR